MFQYIKLFSSEKICFMICNRAINIILYTYDNKNFIFGIIFLNFFDHFTFSIIEFVKLFLVWRKYNIFYKTW